MAALVGSVADTFLPESPKEMSPRGQRYVPNHLLETKIYSKIGSNLVLDVNPPSLYIEGYDENQLISRKIRVLNISSECQRMHILPPSSTEFSISYKKVNILVPGLFVDILVNFKASSYNHHYDNIKIHTSDKDHLMVPLHAYPIINIDKFPRQLFFKAVPVGHSKTKTIQISSDVPVDFTYDLTYIKKHPSIIVEPMSGAVNACSSSKISVTYSPSEYTTESIVLQLVTSQFNFVPVQCHINGASQPGLAKRILEKDLKNSTVELKDKTLNPRVISPLERSRTRKSEKLKMKSSNNDLTKEEIPIVKDGIRFPSNLNCPSAVALVLMQEPGKLSAKDVKKASILEPESKQSRQVKIAKFENLVRQNIKEEENNHLRWCVKLGAPPYAQLASQTESMEPVHDTNELHKHHFKRLNTVLETKRILREAQKDPTVDVTFDMYENNNWERRCSVLRKFVQAGRQVIVRNRLLKILKILQLYKTGEKCLTLEKESEFIDENILELKTVKNLTIETSYHNWIIPKCPDFLKKVPKLSDLADLIDVSPPEPKTSSEVPLLGIKVPFEYVNLGYTKIDTSREMNLPVAPLTRTFRTGALDELINFDISSSSLISKNDLSDRNQEISKMANNNDSIVSNSEKTDIPHHTRIPIPEDVLKAIDYKDFHIFNPQPGVVNFQPSLPYSEVDPDHAMCPVPSLASYGNKPQINLHRQDIIPGVMSWKKHPCHTSVMLNNSPTISNVYLPRRRNPFNPILLSFKPPDLLDGPSECDLEDVPQSELDLQHDINSIDLPTPDMMHAAFPTSRSITADANRQNNLESHTTNDCRKQLPSNLDPSNKVGFSSRSERYSNLENYLKRKIDRLGRRIDNASKLFIE